MLPSFFLRCSPSGTAQTFAPTRHHDTHLRGFRSLLTPVAIAAGRRLADRLYDGQEGRKLDYDVCYNPIDTYSKNESCFLLCIITGIHFELLRVIIVMFAEHLHCYLQPPAHWQCRLDRS